MKFINIICSLILLILFGIQATFACRCFTSPPPCYDYSQFDAIFVGTVKDVKPAEKDFYLQKITVTVDKSYKGITDDVVFTKTGGTSCDFEGFKENRKLLIYGNLYENDKTFFSTGFCTLSTTYSEDLIDFQFLNALNSPEPKYWIWGTISRGFRGSAIEGVRAEVFDNRKKLAGVSDKNGDLKIAVSKEGVYKVRVYIPKGLALTVSDWEEQRKLFRGARMDLKKPYAEYEVEVKNNQCGWFDTPLFDFKN